MNNQIITHTPTLEERVKELTTFTAESEELMEDMETLIAHLNTHWKGAANEANTELYQQWETGHETMLENLGHLTHAINTAKINTAAVQKLHKNMWPPLT